MENLFLISDPNDLTLIENNDGQVLIISNDTPNAGKGACESCGCRGYRPGNTTAYCKCGHHFTQHEGFNW